ncbi:hypothetical protein QJS10_CPA05g00958 [Acorus calamus]|uniref:Centromere/kinetochore protein zw10-like protein n=1 Tax=Acorus calamus TaxID=4465 RepID=A0AAV9EYJ4_ACOCL|nr:hypothetical protein QJS10_CPA05g00958 [Acorus calamus]
MRDLKAALRVAGTEAEEEPKVYGLLREEWGDCFDELQEVLARHMESAVRFETESGKLRVSYEADGVELRRVLEAMEIAGVMDYGFAKVADLMIKHVMNPAVRCASGIVFTEDCNQDSGLNADAILSIIMTSSPDIQGEQLSAVDIYSKLTQVIKFIYKYICFCNNQWMQCFGRLTWPRISELVITSFLSKAIPDDTSKIAEFQNIINYTVEFENVLKEMMFISTGTGDERLSSFAHDVEVHFASRRRHEISTKARNLLLQCDFVLYVENTPKIPFQAKHKPEKNPENSVDLLFETGVCLVSKAASQLMELVHQTLKNVCLSSTKVATEFYHAARDALILYEAIVPIKLEKQLDSISQLAIVVHNDCHYLYQEILGLAFEYRINFPSGVKECAVFADLAMHFHRLSENILGKQVQLICFSLNEAISSANGFQNTHQMQQYESAKFSIDQVVFILEKVHIIWQPLLPTLIYRRTMCIVLEFILSRMTKEILLIDDMAAEETLQLQKLIHLTLENLCSLLNLLFLM